MGAGRLRPQHLAAIFGVAMIFGLSACSKSQGSLLASDDESETCTGSDCVSEEELETTADDESGSFTISGGSTGGSVTATQCSSTIFCGNPPQCCDSGTECVNGACVAACASGVRCGADNATCCADGQACINGSCASPGAPCTDSFECADEEFCEPIFGACLPQFENVSCTTDPVFADFGVTLEWSVEAASVESGCFQPIVAPVVGNLDGDAEGIPELVILTACGGGNWRKGVLRAYRPATQEVLWEGRELGGDIAWMHGRASVAIGDLDNDGLPEVVGVLGNDSGASYRVVAFDGVTGSVKWKSPSDVKVTSSGDYNGAPTLADLDEDGTPEIIFGALVLNADGTRRWERDGGGNEGTNKNYNGGISVVADIDRDGAPDVVVGRRVYAADGTEKSYSPLTSDDGYPAIANFDADDQAEIVLVANGKVYLFDGLTGASEGTSIALPGGGRGGPPTVADFDADGEPEIGIAGSSSYTVYELDGGALTEVWSKTTKDQSSNATGSSVFDFEGDGIAEVVYNDECFMRVYRGTDGGGGLAGAPYLEIANTSATIHEYPIVVDVDADGNSEIVFVANNANITGNCTSAFPGYPLSGVRAGFFIYGDASDQWVRTRRVWHQHAYHVTNVTAESTVPATEAANWLDPQLNNYRQNVPGEGVFNAPDLEVIGLQVDLVGCPSVAKLSARIANQGNLGVPAGVPVAFRLGTPESPGALLDVVNTTAPLVPGQVEVVELTTSLDGSPPFNFNATVDDDGTGAGVIIECEEANEASGADAISCDLLI